MDTDLLFRRVTEPLISAPGETLLRVTYWCLEHEATAEDVLRPDFYLGGEVELAFTNIGSIFITWDENAGWDDHFSVKVCHEMTFLPGALIAFDASRSPLWQANIGSPMLSCSVLGWDEVPHIVSFQFPHGQIFIGDGAGWRNGENCGFGYGDDVLVYTTEGGAGLPRMNHLETLWSAIHVPK